MNRIKPQRTLVDQTYDILLDAICTGDLEAGQRLNQDEIAARLNVSRQPVNSAISVLKANGFVQDTGKRGVVVSAIDARHFQSIYEFRTAIEPFAIRLASDRMPDTAKREATEMMNRGWEAVSSGDPMIQVMADMDFHEMIYRWAGNETILSAMRMNWHHIRRAIAEVVRDSVAARTSWEEHAQIIEALMNGRKEGAVAQMQAHIQRAQDKTIAILNARPAENDRNPDEPHS